MRYALRFLALALIVCAPLAAAPVHFSLTKSSPLRDQTLDATPKRLQLWFSQAPAEVVSEIKLRRDAAEIALGKTTIVAGERTMYADPVKALDNGTYTLTWRAAGDDGHVMAGEVKFVVEIKRAH